METPRQMQVRWVWLSPRVFSLGKQGLKMDEERRVFGPRFWQEVTVLLEGHFPDSWCPTPRPDLKTQASSVGPTPQRPPASGQGRGTSPTCLPVKPYLSSDFFISSLQQPVSQRTGGSQETLQSFHRSFLEETRAPDALPSTATRSGEPSPYLRPPDLNPLSPRSAALCHEKSK